MHMTRPSVDGVRAAAAGGHTVPSIYSVGHRSGSETSRYYTLNSMHNHRINNLNPVVTDHLFQQHQTQIRPQRLSFATKREESRDGNLKDRAAAIAAEKDN